MELTTNTAKRLQEIKKLYSFQGIKLGLDIEIKTIIDFKNELKEIHNNDEYNCNLRNSLCKYCLLIQEIEDVENKNC